MKMCIRDRYILHVPSQRIDQRAVIVSVSRMHYQPCRFIHHHYVWIFINNSKGNKPAGLVVHPGHGNYHGTLVNALAWHMKDIPDYDARCV